MITENLTMESLLEVRRHLVELIHNSIALNQSGEPPYDLSNINEFIKSWGGPFALDFDISGMPIYLALAENQALLHLLLSAASPRNKVIHVENLINQGFKISHLPLGTLNYMMRDMVFQAKDSHSDLAITKLIKLFHENGGDINFFEKNFPPLLHSTIINRFSEASKALIELGADFNCSAPQSISNSLFLTWYEEEKKTTPIELAITFSNKEIAKLLITKGVDVSKIDEKLLNGCLYNDDYIFGFVGDALAYNEGVILYATENFTRVFPRNLINVASGEVKKQISNQAETIFYGFITQLTAKFTRIGEAGQLKKLESLYKDQLCERYAEHSPYLVPSLPIYEGMLSKLETLVLRCKKVGESSHPMPPEVMVKIFSFILGDFFYFNRSIFSPETNKHEKHTQLTSHPEEIPNILKGVFEHYAKDLPKDMTTSPEPKPMELSGEDA